MAAATGNSSLRAKVWASHQIGQDGTPDAAIGFLSAAASDPPALTVTGQAAAGGTPIAGVIDPSR